MKSWSLIKSGPGLRMSVPSLRARSPPRSFSRRTSFLKVWTLPRRGLSGPPAGSADMVQSDFKEHAGMISHDFVLRFALPDPGANPAHFLDALFEAGCDDAVIGIGLAGSVAFDFSRDAASADVAVRSAIEAVMTAIPD